MLSRKERIDEFQLKLTRTEKELYEEFQKTEEAALVLEMQQYFAHAKSQARGIRFDNSLWSKIENRETQTPFSEEAGHFRLSNFLRVHSARLLIGASTMH